MVSSDLKVVSEKFTSGQSSIRSHNSINRTDGYVSRDAKGKPD